MKLPRSISRISFARAFLYTILLTAALSLGACSYNWGSFERISTEAAPQDVQPAGTERVSGSSCRIFLRPRNIAAAARSALTDSPGAKGLKDVRVFVRFFGLFNCVFVEGLPMK